MTAREYFDRTFEARFWSRVEKTATCWLWKGEGNKGYGRLLVQGRARPAAQVAWELQHNAPFPARETIHKCGENRCVRPDHLEPNTLESRFWSKVQKGEGCWEWLGHRDANGYGSMDVSPTKRDVGAYRVAYTLAVGPISPGLHIDHLCRNRGCVRPDHLEAVTPSENSRRRTGWRCEHPYTPENTYTSASRRFCLTCHRRRIDRARDLRHARKAGAVAGAFYGGFRWMAGG